MLYAAYGQTGKMVSRLGFGTLRFRKEDLRDEAGLERCAGLVRLAAARGVNYFDVAPTYAESKAQKIVGMALRGIPGPVYISSKSIITSDRTAEDVYRRVHQTLEILGIPQIAFFAMWSIMDLDHYRRVMAKGGPYEGALRAKKEGLIGHITFSSHCSAEDTAKIIREGGFEGVTISFNALNFTSMRPALDAAREARIGVASMNSLAGGIIPQNPAYFQSLRQSENEDAVTAALRFNASFPEITVALSGMESAEQIDHNTRALSDASALGEERIARFQQGDVPVHEGFCTGCRYCDGCPAGIPIYKYMEAYNTCLLAVEGFEKERMAAGRFFERLRTRWGIVPDSAQNPCLNCGRCEKKCTQHLPVIQRLAQIRQWEESYGFCAKPKLSVAFGAPAHQNIPVGIYGAGLHTENLLGAYRHLYGQPDFPLFLFDGSPGKWGSLCMGLPVYPPSEIEKKGVRRLIISSSRFQEEIYGELAPLAARGVRIVRLYGPGDFPIFG